MASLSATTSTITATPASRILPENTFTITGTLKDTTGTGVASGSIRFGVNQSGSFSPATAENDTNGSGQASVTYTANGVTTHTLRAIGTRQSTGESVAFNGTVAVTLHKIDLVSSSIAASPTIVTGSDASGSNLSTITVTIKNTLGAVIPTCYVQLYCSPTGSTFTPTSGYTNTSGIFTSSFNPDASGSFTITAAAGPGVYLLSGSKVVQAI